MTTAKEMGLAQCRYCDHLTDRPGEPCAVCGAVVHIRRPHSLQHVWAFWLAGLIAYIPGNLQPILITETLGEAEASTIIGGVVALIHHESHLVAAVVFIASIMVPVMKFALIAWIMLSIHFRWRVDHHRRHQAHQLIEVIGRWSMVDVFVVAALAALIQVGSLASIKPGDGVGWFALSVAFTMLSAKSLDPKLLWDAMDDAAEGRPA